MTALLGEIVALIQQEGPISIARYMELVLGHPRQGYYMTRDPLGARGDFTTAPEISQMFGELIGVWLAQSWVDMGQPPRVILAECGPGRGTLMADVLRASRALPAFRAAIDVHLVEISPVLRGIQSQTLANAGFNAIWHTSLADVPSDAPMLLVANEFLDALPIRQFVRGAEGWHERLVGEDTGALRYGLDPMSEPALAVPAPPGAILETCAPAIEFVSVLADRIRRQGGAALLLDYGPLKSGFGDTLQAMKAHTWVDPLANPSEADLTAHVNFEALATLAERAGVDVQGPVTQGAFLLAMGLAARATALAQRASEEQRDAIEAQFIRLTDDSPTGMGRLFKVMALTAGGQAKPPGFI